MATPIPENDVDIYSEDAPQAPFLHQHTMRELGPVVCFRGTAFVVSRATRGFSVEECPQMMRDHINPSLATTVSATGFAIFLYARNPNQGNAVRKEPDRNLLFALQDTQTRNGYLKPAHRPKRITHQS